ncbi:DUF1178 family protein [Azospirillum sp. CT11-132]|uniref:DUF1178 family protein n=1 Tax=unclassified Azospirillum TaxID=2630922 RepID=UPI000D6105DB|nr:MULTISPECIES: DUF1178 family protein [unclassified Azospirillum]PWC64530.1 hypothetical protein TSH20_18070 [Azospirillum sp. TSH20]PWC64658.1 hypothetical protein TSH7_10215 [Azospirillum sp. TSH7]PWC93235.1 hypothetical protein TSO5_15365 [Azospirillum sp. TSO5]QCG97437.1 DUF1178 family protein [Azospirillum sp. TSA2s]
MILFALRCSADHQFEAWFRNGAAYDEQAAAHQIACPICGDTVVGKAPMAPRIAKGVARAADRAREQAEAVAANAPPSAAPAAPANAVPAALPAPIPAPVPLPNAADVVAALPPSLNDAQREAVAEVMRQLTEVRRSVEKNCDYVGDRFAEEARRIHYGESDPRGIYGEASDEEVAELNDEGVTFHRIPWIPRTDS